MKQIMQLNATAGLAAVILAGAAFNGRACAMAASATGENEQATEAAIAPAPAQDQQATLAGSRADNGFVGRFLHYYSDEEGKTGAEIDPSAPAGRRADFPPQPVTSPPYPFTE